MSKQPVQLTQEFDCDYASQRSSAESRAVKTRVHPAGYTVGGEQGTEWKACSQRLCDCHDVRSNSVMLIGKIFSRAAQPALNFVENQQRSRLLGEFAGQLQKLGTHRADSALALNCLHADSTDTAIELPF